MNEVATTNLNLELTQHSLQALTEQRNLLKIFIEKQLVQNADYGIIPGTPKPSLYKPGAEKLTNIFKLGSRIINNVKTIDIKSNYAQIDITMEVYQLATGKALSTCEGIANSHESKNRYRAKYEWVGGKKIKVGEIETPIGDLLNTLSKMAQKRALVGAVILATNASDFFTQDLEDMPDIFDQPKDVTPIKPQQTASPQKPVETKVDMSNPADYVVTFGKFKGINLGEIQDHELDNYVQYLENGAKNTNKPLSGGPLVFVENARKYLSEKAETIDINNSEKIGG